MADAPTPFWLVWSPGGERPPRYRHPSLESATAEADRLAIIRPGLKFYVLAPITSAVAPQVIRERFHDQFDEVPF